MSNPHNLILFASALAILLVSGGLAAIFWSLSYERFEHGRAIRLSSLASSPTRGTEHITASDPPPGGACAAREAEALVMGAANPKAIRCPEHHVAPGVACPSESAIPSVRVDPSWGKVENKEPPPLPEIGTRRAQHSGSDSKVVTVVAHDAAKPGFVEVQLQPEPSADPATVAATDAQRRQWLNVSDLDTFWPVAMPATAEKTASGDPEPNV